MQCGWVHFSRSLEAVTKEVDSFNNYYNSLPADKQELFYGSRPSSVDNYKFCFRCGNSYKNFRDAKDSEIPSGSTIQPILDRDF